MRKVKEHLKPQRVDLAIDNVGGPLFNQVLDTLGEHGRVSCVGRLAGPVPEFNPAESRAAWHRILALLDETGAAPLVDSIHRFDQLKHAFAQLARGPMGKVVLKVS